MKTSVTSNPTLEQVLQAFKNGETVLYKTTDDTTFILNPFGGGTCSTQEVSLINDFELNEEKLSRTIIISF